MGTKSTADEGAKRSRRADVERRKQDLPTDSAERRRGDDRRSGRDRRSEPR